METWSALSIRSLLVASPRHRRYDLRMDKLLLAAALALGGCATVSSASGAGGAEGGSGDTQSLNALSGAAGHNNPPHRSDTTGQAGPAGAPAQHPPIPGAQKTGSPPATAGRRAIQRC